MTIDPQAQLKAVRVEDAVGQHALHDMTRIIPGVEKGAAFVAGQRLNADDICRLQQMGRTHVYTQEHTAPSEDGIHEDDAVLRFATLMPGAGVRAEGAPREGKVNFVAAHDGLFVVDIERLERFNLVPDVVCATRHSMTVVKEGMRLAASRAVPLYLARAHFAKACALLEPVSGDSSGPLFDVLPLRQAKIGILITGTEVFQGRIQDRFAPIITQKAHDLHCTIAGTRIVPDDATAIVQAVHELITAGIDVLVTTAGLSVDPDDVTRKALLDSGLEDALYGMPLLPGSMTLIGRIGTVRVIGVPASGLFFKNTAFDLILPRILADMPPTRLELARLGHGGLCMECEVCNFPQCPFGR